MHLKNKAFACQQNTVSSEQAVFVFFAFYRRNSCGTPSLGIVTVAPWDARVACIPRGTVTVAVTPASVRRRATTILPCGVRILPLAWRMGLGRQGESMML